MAMISRDYCVAAVCSSPPTWVATRAGDALVGHGEAAGTATPPSGRTATMTAGEDPHDAGGRVCGRRGGTSGRAAVIAVAAPGTGPGGPRRRGPVEFPGACRASPGGAAAARRRDRRRSSTSSRRVASGTRNRPACRPDRYRASASWARTLRAGARRSAGATPARQVRAGRAPAGVDLVLQRGRRLLEQGDLGDGGRGVG